MSDTIIILGAGASAEAGAPVMSNFMDVARRLARTPGAEIDREAFERVFNAIAELQTVYAKANIDTDNIEAVFAAFEMGRLFGRIGSLSAEAVDGLPNDMRTLIVQTLETEMALKTAGSYQAIRVEPPVAYARLLQTLKPLIEQSNNHLAFITFNYDLALDYALYSACVRIDYCLRPQPTPPWVPVMKLHGSINWVACTGCQVAAYSLPEYFNKYRWHPSEPGQPVTLSVSSHLDDPFHECSVARETVPLLVTPTWSKAEHHKRVENVWRHAARHLSEARQILVVGYSLPETDHFFRYLYALGTVSTKRLE